MTIEEQVVKLRDESELQWTEIGDKLGLSRDAARRAYSRGKAGREALVGVKKGAMKVWSRRTNWPKLIEDVADGVLADIRQEASKRPSKPSKQTPAEGGYLLEISPVDLHVGKLSWAAETGSDYDIRIAEQVFTDAIDEILERASRDPIESILLVCGNDLLQTDNLAGTTTAGTFVDTDSRYVKSFRRARRLQSWAIRRCLEIAPVKVIVVPGNHDRLTAFHLGEVLEAEFAVVEGVEIDNSPTLRKYHRHGVNLLGFTHGSEERPADLPLIMAQECSKEWAETEWREFHVGHLHRAKETRYTAGDSFNGVRVRILPSLCAPDAWHSQMGYTSEKRACEAYLWHRERGYAGHLSANVRRVA